ncbi:hypothetical protein HGQ82_18750, partial [Clostridioides difficile]|nr:hypothetical protein [Clostridioides difficile]
SGNREPEPKDCNTRANNIDEKIIEKRAIIQPIEKKKKEEKKKKKK